MNFLITLNTNEVDGHGNIFLHSVLPELVETSVGIPVYFADGDQPIGKVTDCRLVREGLPAKALEVSVKFDNIIEPCPEALQSFTKIMDISYDLFIKDFDQKGNVRTITEAELTTLRLEPKLKISNFMSPPSHVTPEMYYIPE